MIEVINRTIFLCCRNTVYLLLVATVQYIEFPNVLGVFFEISACMASQINLRPIQSSRMHCTRKLASEKLGKLYVNETVFLRKT